MNRQFLTKLNAEAFQRQKEGKFTWVRWWAELTEAEQLALYVTALDRLVNEGGFLPWCFKTYVFAGEKLRALLIGVGTPAAMEVAEMLRFVVEAFHRHCFEHASKSEFRAIAAPLESRFAQLHETLLDEVEAHLKRQSEPAIYNSNAALRW